MVSLCLHGKDGAAGQHELNITAQVTLVVTAGGVSVSIVFCIQQDSAQDCLIGMNVAPTSGLSFLDNQGKPLKTRGSQSSTNASVNLIQTQPVPARSRSFIKAEFDAELGEGVCVVFEPNPCSLEAYGLIALESIMQVINQRKVFVPVVNYHQRDVYMNEGTVLGSVEVYSDGVSDLTQSLEVADCDSSVDTGGSCSCSIG